MADPKLKTSNEQALLELSLAAPSSFLHILHLATELHASGQFDCMAPLPKGGTFFSEILSQKSGTRGYAGLSGFDVAEANKLADLSAQTREAIWGQRTKEGPLFALLLSNWTGAHDHFPNPYLLAKTIQAARVEDLRAWKWKQGYRSEAPCGLLQAILCSGMHQSEEALALPLQALYRHNFSIKRSKTAEGKPMALLISTCSALNLFLAEEGNLRERVQETDNCDAVPLWQHLLRKAQQWNNVPLTEQLQQWAAENEKEADEQRQLNDYFKSLPTYQADGQTLRAHPRWPEVVDANGCTAMMHFVSKHGSKIKQFWNVKKSVPGCAKKNKNGHSLWHYMMAQGKEAPSGTDQFLAKALPLHLDAQGRGLIPALIQFHGTRTLINEHTFLFSESMLTRTAQKFPDAQLWFACPTPEIRADIVLWLNEQRYMDLRSPSPTRMSSSLSTLSHHLDRASLLDLDPYIKGALALNEYMIYTQRGSASESTECSRQLTLELIESGALLKETDTLRTRLAARLTEAQIGHLFSLFESVHLEQETRLAGGHKVAKRI